MLVQVVGNETIQAHAQEFTERIEHGLRESSGRLISTSDLPDVLTGAAEVIDGRTLRYVDTDLTVQLVGIEICDRNQKATFEGTPWPCADMATAWLVSQTLGRDIQCQRLGRRFDGVIQGRCAVEGGDIAAEAILAGHAFADRATRPGVPIPLSAYINLEDRAREARTGLWSSDFSNLEALSKERSNNDLKPLRHIQMHP